VPQRRRDKQAYSIMETDCCQLHCPAAPHRQTQTYSNIVFPTGAIMTDDKISGIQLRITCLLIALNHVEFKLKLQIMRHTINAY
jgi:hypothetical protein